MAERLTETAIISEFFAPLAPDGDFCLGMRDDAAYLSPLPGHDLVLTTDTIVAGVHFLTDDDPFDIAVKAVTVNLSDLTVKGADPLAYLVNLSLPAEVTIDKKWFERFSNGLAEQIAGKLYGGDLSATPGPLTVSITAIGQVLKGKMVRRSGAKPGDHLFVTAPVGTSAAGLKALINPPWVKKSGLSATAIGELANAYRRPLVSFAEFHAQTIRTHASASIDLSDGFAKDLSRLCQASGCGAEITIDTIPLNPIVQGLIDGDHWTLAEALNGGDDYCALFCVPPIAAKRFIGAEGPEKIFHVGKLTDKENGICFIDAAGKVIPISITGYDHFTKTD